jgi:hypothetical protein
MEYDGDLIPQHDRRVTDRMQEWPTLPELYRTMNTLNSKIDALNGKLSNGIPKRIDTLEQKVNSIEHAQMICIFGRAGIWKFLTGLIVIIGGVSALVNVVGKLTGFW